MHRWTRGIMGDDPPYLTVGTEVSAKYKGAFCEAKVRKVVRSVKCKVTFKLGLGSAIVSDDQVRGTLRVGSACEVKHPEKKEYSEAILNKIQDCSQYTVVFDDGDITTLRRSALCLKSGRHFAESETLDQLPLTHPEHFSNPVIGGRKGRRSRQAHEESSEEEGTVRRGKRKEEKEEDIGRMVCVELGDKKKQKDNWFPGLVVAPTAQDAVRIKVRDEYLVRSFKDGRYFTVPKKEATEFTREIGAKVENNTLKTAVEKALLFLDRDELPPHWDRDLLFGVDDSAASDSEGGLDSDSSDDEPREEKDHFVAQLYKFMDDRGTPINKGPAIGNKDIDLYKLFKVVHKLGGYNRVTNHNQWKTVAHKVGFGQSSSSITNLVKQAYKKFLHSFEEFYRKLGCTMVNHPRGNRSRQHAGRSLIRDRDRATPVNIFRDKDKAGHSSADSGSEIPVKEITESVAKLEEVAIGAASEDDTVPGVEEVVKEVVPKREERLKTLKKEVTAEEVPCAAKSTVKDEPISTTPTRVLKKEKVVDEEKKKGEPVASKSGSSKDSPQTETASKLKKVDESKKEESVVIEKSTPLSRREERAKEDTKVAKSKDEKPKAAQHKSDRIKVLGERGKIKEEKSEVPEKIKEEVKEEVLKVDEEKNEKTSKKRPERKEDEEKHTRSKSKEDLFAKKDGPPERRSREPEKRLPPRLKKPEEEEESLNKRGRKRKETETKPSPEEGLGQLSSNIAVGVGDKLKVYYGPTHESKVTYEAKVIDMEKDTFLVHYTGWNTRYDEWIKRGRIAENLSWTPSRAKRLKQQQLNQAKTSRPSLGKRGRPSGGRDSVTPNQPRSTTPSSVTSSSSRTKSPGTPAPRSTRPSLGLEYRRRTRRMSGHTDMSLEASESESESDSERSEPGIEPVRTRSRSERLGDKEHVATKLEEKEEVKRPLRRSMGRRKDVVEVEAEDEREEDSTEQMTETDVSSDPQVVETRRSKRTRKAASVTPTQKEDEQKREPSTESEEEQPQPKGRDFDLNQIRSELKGIEKTVKQPQDTSPGDAKDSQLILDDKTGIIDVKGLSGDNSTPSPNKVSEETAKTSPANTTTDDIYEFKEPEPFDFEVRSKREIVLPEERPKLNRKQSVKVVEEAVEAKIEKSLPVRKKLIRNTPTKNDAKESEPVENVTRKRFRRAVTKSPEKPVDSRKKEMEISREASPEPSTSVKGSLVSACEEAFDKLCESPVFRPASQPRRTPSPSAVPNIEPINLFSDLPEGKYSGYEIEDRLVILEPGETETDEPLFTYSQRHHEELLPTLPTETVPAGISDQAQTLPRIQLSTGAFSTLSKNITSSTVKSPSLRKKSSIPVLDKKVAKAIVAKAIVAKAIVAKAIVAKAIVAKKEQNVTSRRKEIISGKKEVAPVPVLLADSAQFTNKDFAAPIICEGDSSMEINKVETSSSNKVDASAIAVANKKELVPATTMKKETTAGVRKESGAVAAKKEMVTTKKELGAAVAKKEPVALVPKKEATTVCAKKEASPVVSKKTSTTSPKKEPQPSIPKKEASAAVSKKETVGILKKETSPIVLRKETSPVVLRKETSPSLVRKDSSPVLRKEECPIAPRSEGTPLVLKTESSPPVLRKELNIVMSKTDASTSPTKELTSIITKKEATPAVTKKESSPVTNKKVVGVNVGKKDSNTAVKKASSPSVVKKDSSPIMKRKDTSPVNKKKDTCSTVKKKESLPAKQEEIITKESVYSSPQSRLDSDNLMEGDDELYPDDPISAAIQRVISQSMTDEDSNDFDVLPKTTPNVQSEKKLPKSETPVSMTDVQRKENLKRKSGGRKPVLSQEFVEDSDSDSSDEEHRLVIAKIDDDDSQSRLGEESSSSHSLTKHPASKDTLDVSANLEENVPPAKEDHISTKLETNVAIVIAEEISSDKRIIIEEAKVIIVEADVAKSTSVPGAFEKVSLIMEVDTVKKEIELQHGEACKSQDEVSGELLSAVAEIDAKNEDNDCSVPSLLCEETIPGSPTPMCESVLEENICNPEQVESRAAILEMPFASAPSCSSTNPIQPVAVEMLDPPQVSHKVPETTPSLLPGAAAPVIENTPPTTPDSSLSITSGSPTEEHPGMSPTMDNESVKSHRDSFEGDSSAEGNKVENYSDEDSLLNIELSNSSDNRLQGLKSLSKKLNSDISSPKKRRRSRKRSECDSNKRLKSLAGQSNRLMAGGGSDSDDTSENSTPGCLPLSSSENVLPARSPRPSKYNFYVELDPELDGSQRIALLQQKLQELRKTYMSVKAELACIDRRRKKLRRREREDKATKQEVSCS